MDLNNGVIILYNLPKRSADSNIQESEYDVLMQVDAVSKALDTLSIPSRRIGITGPSEVFSLENAQENIVFNLVESFSKESRLENLVPEVLTSINKAYTGNKRTSLDKWVTKSILQKHSISCPKGFLVMPGQDYSHIKIGEGKYIVKPASSDGSEGIDSSSVVSSFDELEKAITRIHQEHLQSALVEEYIDGRELNIAVFQDKNEIKIMPIAEIDFSNFGPDRPRIVDYSAKWHEDSFEYKNTNRVIPANLPEEVKEKIISQVRHVSEVINFSGYLRVDLRLDNDLNPYVLEVNLNPCISRDAGFSAALDAAGIKYHDFILKLLESAIYEFERKDTRVRFSLLKDKETILDLLRKTNFFKDHEHLIAKEVLEEAISSGPEGHYKSYVADVSGIPVGWICFGEVPCTIGTYDIYWLAVSPEFQNKGIGRALVKHAEENILHNNGRIIAIETCGDEKYKSTQKFYEKNNYTESARIKDFYQVGEDKIIYTKTLS